MIKDKEDNTNTVKVKDVDDKGWIIVNNYENKKGYVIYKWIIYKRHTWK